MGRGGVGAAGYAVDRSVLVVVPAAMYAFHEASLNKRVTFKDHHDGDDEIAEIEQQHHHDGGGGRAICSERAQLLELIDVAQAIFAIEEAGMVVNVAAPRTPLLKRDGTNKHVNALMLSGEDDKRASARARMLLRQNKQQSDLDESSSTGADMIDHNDDNDDGDEPLPDTLLKLLRDHCDARKKLAHPIALEHAFGVSGVSFDALLLPGARPDAALTLASRSLRECPRAKDIVQHFATHAKIIATTADGIDVLLLALCPKSAPRAIAGGAIAPALPASYITLDPSTPFLKNRKVASPAVHECDIPLEQNLFEAGARLIADKRVVQDGTLITAGDVDARHEVVRELITALLELDEDDL